MYRLYDPMTAPNGMNFKRSVGNPHSRLEKTRTYLAKMPFATKREILRNVFGKTIVPRWEVGGHQRNRITRGWGAYLFTYGIKHGYFEKIRSGNAVFYRNGPAGGPILPPPTPAPW